MLSTVTLKDIKRTCHNGKMSDQKHEFLGMKCAYNTWDPDCFVKNLGTSIFSTYGRKF